MLHCMVLSQVSQPRCWLQPNYSRVYRLRYASFKDRSHGRETTTTLVNDVIINYLLDLVDHLPPTVIVLKYDASYGLFPHKAVNSLYSVDTISEIVLSQLELPLILLGIIQSDTRY